MLLSACMFIHHTIRLVDLYEKVLVSDGTVHV